MRTPGTVAVTVALAVALSSAAIPVAAHGNHLSADSQVSTDGTLVVESVLPVDEAWIVVRTDEDGSPGEVLGHVPVDADEGLRTDVAVDIEDEAWGNWSGTRPVWTVLHAEDGDGEFDPEDDEMLESFGEPAGDRIQVRKGDAPAYVTAEEFSPQPSDDGTVVVRTAAVPGDGYVVVHDATGEGPGDVVGSTAVASGLHDTVAVDLDAAFFEAREGTVTLWAVLYTDDGSGRFDGADDPVRVGDDTVSTAFGVERTTQQSPTPGADTADGGIEGGHGDQDHDDHEHGDDDHPEHDDRGTDQDSSTVRDGTATEGSGAGTMDDGSGFGLAGAGIAFLATALIARVRRR